MKKSETTERLLKEKDTNYIKELFEKNLKDDVTLTLFWETNGPHADKFNEQYLPYTEEIVKEVSELSDKHSCSWYMRL